MNAEHPRGRKRFIGGNCPDHTSSSRCRDHRWMVPGRVIDLHSCCTEPLISDRTRERSTNSIIWLEFIAAFSFSIEHRSVIDDWRCEHSLRFLPDLRYSLSGSLRHPVEGLVRSVFALQRCFNSECTYCVPGEQKNS